MPICFRIPEGKPLSNFSSLDLVESEDINWTRDTVFSEPPVKDQFGEDGLGSGSSSFDGGATATVKFSALALANNTLLLPHRESQEDEENMPSVPVQMINYNPLEPISRPLNRSADSPSDMDLSRATSNRTIAQPSDMDLTRATSNRTIAQPSDMDLTRATSNRTIAQPSDMDLTRATSNRTIAQPSDMDLTRATSNRTIAQPSDTDLTRAISNRTIAQPPDMDLTRATSNRTIVQPSDRDLTRATSNRNIAQPSDTDLTRATINGTIAQPSDIDLTRATSNRTIAQPSDMDLTRATSNRTIAQPSDMDLTRATSNRTIAQPLELELTRYGATSNIINAQPYENNKNQHLAPERSLSKIEMDKLLREQFPSPVGSPEPTAILGMMPRFNKSINFNDELTSFAPKGESTRMINFKVSVPDLSPVQGLNSSPLDITSFAPSIQSTKRIDFRIPMPEKPQVASLSPYPQDVTSFAPCIESTRKIDFLIPPPDISPVRSVNRSADNDRSNQGSPTKYFNEDVTSFAPAVESTRKINFPIPSLKISSVNQNMEESLLQGEPKSLCVSQVIHESMHPRPELEDLQNLTSSPGKRKIDLPEYLSPSKKQNLELQTQNHIAPSLSEREDGDSVYNPEPMVSHHVHTTAQLSEELVHDVIEMNTETRQQGLNTDRIRVEAVDKNHYSHLKVLDMVKSNIPEDNTENNDNIPESPKVSEQPMENNNTPENQECIQDLETIQESTQHKHTDEDTSIKVDQASANEDNKNGTGHKTEVVTEPDHTSYAKDGINDRSGLMTDVITEADHNPTANEFINDESRLKADVITEADHNPTANEDVNTETELGTAKIIDPVHKPFAADYLKTGAVINTDEILKPVPNPVQSEIVPVKTVKRRTEVLQVKIIGVFDELILRNSRRDEKGTWSLEEFDESLKYGVFRYFYFNVFTVLRVFRDAETYQLIRYLLSLLDYNPYIRTRGIFMH